MLSTVAQRPYLESKIDFRTTGEVHSAEKTALVESRNMNM
jgi:hypothetical protein